MDESEFKNDDVLIDTSNGRWADRQIRDVERARRQKDKQPDRQINMQKDRRIDRQERYLMSVRYVRTI